MSRQLGELLNLLAPLPIVVLCALAGRALASSFARDGEQTAPYRWLIATFAGLAGLHLWLMLLDLAAVPWTLVTVGLPLVFLATVGLARARRGRIVDAPLRPGWGDLAAAGALAIFAFLLRDACLAMSDYVYHWGIKGQRYWLEGGVDYDFLLRSWNLNKHPDYPNLVPELFAVTALVRGVWVEPALIAWSLFFVLALAIGAREGLRVTRASSFAAQTTLAATVAMVVAVAIGALLGGSPDLLIAALLVAAAAPLLAPPDDARDLQLGLIAAVAVAAKVEGLPLALLLAGAQLLRRRRAALPFGVAPLARLLGPALVVGLPWWYQIASRGLARESRFGGLRLDDAGDVAAALLQGLAAPLWHGLPFLLILLPLPFLRRRLRPLALVVAGQLLFYLAVYLTTAGDPVWLVRTSQPRLLLHLLPALLLLVGIALDRPRKIRKETR